MQTSLLLHTEGVAVHQNHPRGAHRHPAHAGTDDAAAQRLTGLIAAASCHRRLPAQSGVRSGSGTDRAHCRLGLHTLRQPFPPHGKRPAHFLGILPCLDVIQAAAGHVGDVGDQPAGQAVDEVVLGKQHPADFPIVLRFMLLHPENLRRKKGRENDICRMPEHGFQPKRRGHPFRLRRAALVIPQNRRTDYLPPFVQHNQRSHHARNRQAGHLAPLSPGQHVADTGTRRLIPVLRVLLRPARPGYTERIFVISFCQNGTGLIGQHDLAARCTDVDSQQVHKLSLHCCFIRVRRLPGEPELFGKYTAKAAEISAAFGFSVCPAQMSYARRRAFAAAIIPTAAPAASSRPKSVPPVVTPVSISGSSSSPSPGISPPPSVYALMVRLAPP